MQQTQALFQQLSWVNLLLSALTVHYYIAIKTPKLYAYYCIVFCIGMLAEIIGVHTHFLFGSYYYTPVLGWSIFGVPLIIGVNWIVLTYCTAKLLDLFNRNHRLINIILGAIAMVALDVLLEFFAIKHHLWVWQAREYPSVQNFIGWFVVAVCTHSVHRILVDKSKNQIAIAYLFVLICFLIVDLILGFLM